MYTFPMRQISYQATRTNSAKGDICAEIYLINVCQDTTRDIVPEIRAGPRGSLAFGVAFKAGFREAFRGSLLGQPFGVAFRG